MWLEELAHEYYQTRKEHYASVPEERASSHILFATNPGDDRTEVRKRAQEVLAQLRDGADFVSLVQQHSDDPSSAARGGALKEYSSLGD